MIDLTCTTEQRVPLAAAATKSTRNKVVPLRGPLRAVVVEGDGTVERGASDAEVFLVSGKIPGVTVFRIEGDLYLDGKTVTVRESVRLTVVGAFEGTLGLAPGEPVEKGGAHPKAASAPKPHKAKRAKR